ncbi:MAG TPA: hypothetical protein VF190_12500 [Rhodothermales bacterium]
MHPIHLRILAVAFVLASAPLAARFARAQEDPQQPDLPDIAPREVEIRGQLEISFPSLQRQPLIGFNPPPRLPEIPADRIPFIEDYKQESVDLPPSPLAPPSPPGLAGLETYPPTRVELDASAGRYFSRTIRGRAGIPLGTTEAFTARLNYAGLDSYTPFQREAPYNLFDGAVGLSTNRGTLNAGAEVGGFVDTYDLFGAIAGGGAGTLVPQPTRDGRGLETAAWLRTTSAAGTDAHLRVEFASSAYETDVFADEQVEEGPQHRASQRFGADGQVEFAAGVGRIGVDASFGRSSLDEALVANSASTSYDAAAYVRFPVANRLQLIAGARLMGFELEVPDGLDPATGVPDDETVIAPDVRLEMYLAHGAMLYVQNRPAIEQHDLIDLYEANPFLVAEPIVAPSVRTLEVEGGGRFFIGPVQVGLRGGYRDYPTFLFFEHAGLAEGYERGFSAARYDEATVVYGGGDLSIAIARGVQATLGATGRRGRLADDTVIPYFGSVVGNAMLSILFDRSKGLIQLTGTYESSRFRDRTKTRELGDFFDMDLLASYQVTPILKVLFAVDNISADRLERYDGYPLPPFVVRGGLGVRW